MTGKMNVKADKQGSETEKLQHESKKMVQQCDQITILSLRRWDNNNPALCLTFSATVNSSGSSTRLYYAHCKRVQTSES
jgi:hypothetical protein